MAIGSLEHFWKLIRPPTVMWHSHNKCVLGCTTLANNILNLNLNPNLNPAPNPKLTVLKLGCMYPYASRGAFAYLKGYIWG